MHDESPLVVATLHRLLLAILERALAPRTREDWVALWLAERLPEGPIGVYLDRWRERFDLFHPERPFLQVAGLEEKLKAERNGEAPERTPMWRMLVQSSQCGGHIHIFERMPQYAALPPAAAARGLLAFQAYTSGGRIQNERESWQGGLLRGGAVVLVQGATLRETLLGNLLWRRQRGADDLPPWERDEETRRVRRQLAGPVDLLVWPSRRVALFPLGAGDAVEVEEVLTAAGERLKDEPTDEQFSYVVRSPKLPPMAVRFDPGRTLWRDCAALFDGGSLANDVHQRPAALNQLAELVAAGAVPARARHRVQILGLSPDKASIRFWRAEHLLLPARLLTDGDALAALREGLESAEEVGGDLNRSVLFVLCERALSPGDRQAHKDDIQNLKDSLAAIPSYWSELGQAFPSWLLALGDADDPDDALPAWRDAIRRAARGAFDDACRRLGTHARSLQAAAQAEVTLRRMLVEHLGSATPSPTAPTQEGATP